MRIVADECCDFSVVRSLRASGHTVIAIAEVSPRLEDHQVLDLAALDKTLLLTVLNYGPP
jgi:hypothetical protein